METDCMRFIELKFALEIYYILTSLGHYTLFEEKVGGTEIWKLNKSYSEYFKVLWTICSVIYFSNEAKGKIERVLVSSSFVWKITQYIPVFKAQYIFLFKKNITLVLKNRWIKITFSFCRVKSGTFLMWRSLSCI